MDKISNLRDPSSKEARASRLIKLREMTQPKLTRKDVYQKYGLSSDTLRHYETARGTGLTEQGAKLIADIYQKENIDCSVSWLLHGKGEPPQYRVLGGAPSIDKPTYQIDLIVIHDQLIAYFKSLNPEAVTYTILDDSMEPFFRYGDTIGGIRHYAKDFHRFNGCDCIVETKGGQTLFGRLRTHANIEKHKREKYDLFSLNPDSHVANPHHYAIDILTVAPVMLIWRGKKWPNQ